MEAILELSGLTLEEINLSYQHLIDLLIGLDQKVQFDLANSIWYKSSLPQPEEMFLQRCQQYFDALVTGLDFTLPEAAPTINNWVHESTSGKIEEVVDDPIAPYICTFLINAIYFKGNWVYQFDDDLTQDTLFYRPDGTTTTCQMMSQRAPHAFFYDGDLMAVDLPYGDGAYSMTIFVPWEQGDVDAFIAGLDTQNLNNWLEQFVTDSINVFIPRFKLEYSRELKDDLTALGMGIAFDPDGANFRNMYKSMRVWIDKVKHKTFVEVNEEGTEAAAVTSVEMAYESETTPDFRADTPFVFMIRENQSGTILFIGKIVDPTASQ
jgi:serpin B